MLKKKEVPIIWEEKEEEKKKSKFKTSIEKTLQVISKYSGLIETIIILYTAFNQKNNNTYWLLILALGIFSAYRYIKNLWKIKKSKMIIQYESRNKRVVGQEGAQGAGKTSLMCYVASVLNAPVFSSAPMKINGQMTYVLDEDIINMNVRIPLYSILIFDEITLYYDNELSKQIEHKKTEGLEMQMQLIRHCFDGNMLTASVDMNRLAKRVEEKHGMFRRLLGQDGISTSFIIDPMINIFAMIFNLNVKTGIRCWTYQTFENINHKGYVFDLSRQDKNTNDKKFANLVEIRAWNNSLNFEYDDRYFKRLYHELPKAQLKKWNNLTFEFEELKTTGFTNVINFFKSRYEKIKRKEGA